MKFRSAFLAVIGVLAFAMPISAHAATLYFADSVDNSWTNVGNWWSDSGHSVPAGGLPTTGDTAYVDGTVINMQTVDLANLYIGTNSDTNVQVAADAVITVSGDFQFGRNSYSNGDITGPSYTLVGNPVLTNGSTIENATIQGNVTLRQSGTLWNTADVIGSVNLFDMSLIQGGNISSVVHFHDRSSLMDTVTFGSDIYMHGGDPKVNGGIVGTGTRYRYYDATSSSLGVGINFQSEGPWTIVADGVTVDVSGGPPMDLDETSPTKTSFLEVNGGTITGKPAVPILGSLSASDTTKTSVNFNGSVTDNNFAPVTYHGFDYGRDPSYGSTISESGSFSVGGFSLGTSGLECGSTYHYRLFAHNYAGTTTSPDNTFTTSPCFISVSSGSSSGGTVSVGELSRLLTPGSATDAYLALRGYQDAAASSIHPLSTTTAFFTMNLSIGMKDREVQLLQKYLNTHGFTVAVSGPGSSGNESDFFGLQTLHALKKFQSAHTIPATGNLGPQTRAYIQSH